MEGQLMTQADEDRYTKALHAMQTGVMYQMEPSGNPAETQPKHLRVGVNAALIDSGAMAKLLIDKGIITLDEYQAALADMAEREVAHYTELVNRQFGGTGNITLA
jgi:hypothetical protein